MSAARATLILAASAIAGALMGQPWGPHLDGTSRVIIMGLPTCGKTTLARKFTAESFRTVWYDVAEDYSAPGRLDTTAAELAKYPALLDDPHARLVVKPQSDHPRDMAEEVALITSLAFEHGNLVLCLDEVGDYRKESERTLNRLFRRGRHAGIASVLVSQFATDFPLTVRRAASEVHVLAQKHRAELDALAVVYGEDFAERVAAWRKYEPPITWRLSEV